jgi:hypothetical protein
MGHHALAWKSSRNIRIAVAATLDSLSAWQAYRPQAFGRLKQRLVDMTTDRLFDFQSRLLDLKITSLDSVPKPPHPKYERFLVAMAEAVGKLSAVKGSDSPMLGSKIMHFMLPEFFPVWDTAIVKKKALNREKAYVEQLGEWLPGAVKRRLSSKPYCEPANEYARYVALMMKDLWNTPIRKYHSLERALIRSSKAGEEVIDFHYHDLAPSLFEVCLIGKHRE